MEQIQNAMATGGTTIGALLYWRGLHGVKIDRERFRTEMEAIGLGDAVKRDPSPARALNLAAGSVSKGRRKGSTLVESKGRDDDRVFYSVMLREEGERRRYVEQARVAVLKQRPADGSPNPSLEITIHADTLGDRRDVLDAALDELRAEYDEVLHFVGAIDVSEALSNAMALMNAVTLRPGVYFVPSAELPRARALQGLIQRETTTRVSVWDVAESDANVEEARESSRESFSDAIRSLRDEMEGFRGALPADLDAAEVAKRAARRVERFTDLSARVELYADILGSHAARLSEELAETKRALLDDLLGGDSAAA